jgi:glycosyltransferase involved in cell wall biosynthesis
MGLPAAFVKWRNPTLKFILTLQDGDSMAHIMRRLRIRPIAPLIRKMFRSADSVQSISSFLSTFAIAMGHDKTTNVIPNGVTVDIFQKRNIEREIGLKRKLNILEHEKIVVTTSRLVEKNGIDDLIASLAHLPADFRLLVVGEGPLEDALRALVSRLKLEERVIFAGFVPHADLPTYLHVSNVFSRPSHSEGMGISFIEAMAAGIPVVTTAVGGIPDFLKDQETGLFVEVKNPTDIANKIQLLLNDEKLRTHIVEEARLMVQRKYDWNIVSHAMEQLFMRVIS